MVDYKNTHETTVGVYVVIPEWQKNELIKTTTRKKVKVQDYLAQTIKEQLQRDHRPIV